MIFELIDIISEWFYPVFFAFSVLVMILYHVTDSIRDYKQKSIER